MSNEDKNKVEGMVDEQQSDKQPNPMDLEQAFKQVREEEQKSTKDDVADTGESEPTKNEPKELPNDESASINAGADGGDTGGQPDVNTAGEGSVETPESIQQTPETRNIEEESKQRLTELSNQLMREAQEKVITEFEEANVKLWEINRLFVEDKETGTVSFVNPDTGEKFANRLEANEWVKTMNEQIKMEAQKQTKIVFNELKKQNEPRIKLLNFLPKYEKMDELTKGAFMDIVSDTAVEENGQVIGYAADLDQAHAQAKRVVQRLASQAKGNAKAPAESSPKETPAPAGPAVDTPKSGNNAEAKPKDPTNLAEAFKIVNDIKKESK